MVIGIGRKGGIGTSLVYIYTMIEVYKMFNNLVDINIIDLF